MYISVTRRSLTLVACEALLIGVAIAAAVWLRTGTDVRTLLLVDHGFAKAALIVLVCQLCLYYSDMYELRSAATRDIWIGTVQALAATSFLLAAIYFWFPDLIIAHGVFAIATILMLTLVAGWRVTFGWLSHQVAPRERLLLVGTGHGAVSLARELVTRRQELGVEIVGFVDAEQAKVEGSPGTPGVLGTIEDIPSIVRARAVDRVVVSLADARGKLPMDKLLEMKLEGVSFDHLASVYEELTGKIAVENLRPSWLIFSSGFRKSPFLEVKKRLLDIVIAAAGLVLTAPVMVVVAAAVRVTSPGHPLFHQRRVGRDGRVFTLYKFRSMRRDAEAGTGAVWARKDDPRITPVGRFLRRTRLDELPQLWNVLIGDMSIVGPRPERPEFVTLLTKDIPFYGQRHVVRPGLTGWAQVRYSYGSSIEDALEKLQFDLFYIKNRSIWMDLFIIFSTVKTVILRKGA